MRSILQCLPAVLIVLATACDARDRVTTPSRNPELDQGGRAGIYVLRSVAGEPLPAQVIANEAISVSILADTIFLHADGTGAVVPLEQVMELRPVREYVQRYELPVTYAMASDRLTAEIPCRDVIPFAACLKPPHFTGALSAGALDLDYSLAFRVPLHYERVAGPSVVTSVQISPSSNLSVRTSGSLQLVARALDAQGNPIAGKRLSWTSLISSAATVSATGLVRGVVEGNTLITAFVDGRADTVTVKVTR